MYEFIEDMGEISGFGGGYEQGCRDMLRAGLEWCDANPAKNPEFSGYENIYGIINENNDDAKELSGVVSKTCKDGCTGAMHQAVIETILWVKKNGWDKYVKEMSKPKEEITK